MRWTVCIILFMVALLPFTISTGEVEADHGLDDEFEQVEDMSELQSAEKESHHHIGINPRDLNTGENSVRDSLVEDVLFEQADKMESSIAFEKTSQGHESLKKNSHDNELHGECIAETLYDELYNKKLKCFTDDSQMKNEQPTVNDNIYEADLATNQNEEELSDYISKADENKINMQNEESDTGSPTKKRRYFPLLYTFGSMFTSFLAEFGDISSSSDATSSNSSVQKNSTSEDGLASNSNITSNSTDQGKKTRFQCALHLKNTSNELNGTAMVKIINSTELLEILNFSKNQKSAASPCVLVMFYTKWCHFSAQAAPEYNALARAFPQLDVLAVDTSHFSYLNAKFGTVAVPNIMIFHSRSAVRFNHTTRDLDNFIQFVHNNTGLEPTSSIAVLPEDYEGPLSSKVVQGRDWLLWLAWAFILVCSIYGFFFSLYGQAVITRLRVLWAEHQHIA